MRPSEFAGLLTRPRGVPFTRRRHLGSCATVADLRSAAQRILPRAVFDFLEGGAEDELTLRRNSEAFGQIDLVPHVLRDVSAIDLRTSVLGRTSALPLLLAPTGSMRLFRDGGELDAARAAHTLGIPCVLSTMANTPVEAAAAVGGDLWFQLYVLCDRGLTRELIARARASNCRVLVLTVDSPVVGGHDRDVRNGIGLPATIGPRVLLDGLRHPRWSWQFARGRLLHLPHLGIDVRDRPPPIDPALDWNDIEWISGEWGGPIVVKGVLSAADARQAVNAGAAGLVVSNHGGRQLDGAPATIDVLPEIVDAVGDQVEVLLDSGIRRGADMIRALSLGARACLIGRAYLYGLAVGGQAGVEHAVRILETELQRALMLVGATSSGELDARYVRFRQTEHARS